MKLSHIFALAITFTLASTTATFAQSATEKTEIAASFTTLNTKVKGITCSSDLKTISANVEKLEGVNACKPGKTGPTTQFEIAYDPALVSEDDIFTAIQNTAGCEDPNDRPYKVKK
ncbi:hypothetical protein BN863_13640 [Formosa agariphila KMM 3901]|uniref:Uncharacterized protein n=1 Tax=Formosa agariphila (strain DSM 15362 / KCTC 12365 / LMG 23005 / KMM 3901 / M-2Alg 35-1) TaxID=1347342 RepID=T2KKW6_FORAG|nr:hypothetical protein [Formosa agariphila]CDF79076.1 hypothetical protein BN863_13640 [Formosa agariphila KMM 3901]